MVLPTKVLGTVLDATFDTAFNIDVNIVTLLYCYYYLSFIGSKCWQTAYII